MEIKNGIPVSPGIIISKCCLLEAEDFRIQHKAIESEQIEDEVKRVEKAFQQAAEQVRELSKKYGSDDSGIRDIFAVHVGFLSDESLIKRVSKRIREKSVCSEYAVSNVLKEISGTLSSSSDNYVRERVSDIYDIEKRLLRVLTKREYYDLGSINEECVVIANDLSPTQTASLNLDYVKGFATNAGGRTSHTAIVARSIGIPAIVALEDITSSAEDGDTIILDGYKGTVLIRPDSETLEEYRRYSDDTIAVEQKLQKTCDLPAETTDGVKVSLGGNIELPQEADIVASKGGEGVGLYRTEFLYLQNDKMPSEQDHYNAYLDVIRRLGGRPLVIRTMDLGADKMPSDGKFPVETNPVLGLRSIRYCLTTKNLPLFRTQLRAILRASAQGDIKIMFPLITTVEEVRHAKMVVRDVMEDLADDGFDYDFNIKIGIMIETPSSALISAFLAKEVDFFSIGTNDLIQYTLAVDRANEKLASLYSPGQPAVIKLIKEVVRNAKKAGTDVCVCGEMASEPEFVPLLLGLGVRSFSVAAPRIPEIKLVIRALDIPTCEEVARRAGCLETRRSVINYLRDTLMGIVPEVQ
ncbi:Phosphoenolpyruvate-protein phosphotransferase [Sedimentisphaera cyanobacteriorum]|uniref:Phosphoenolpyruvate-protein phosphotransferase n=1 Tax=Sedimentisphaera cyanobacteriorum TaxID=1940790 RepID=A0A1Q2HQI1_9BACT|nr:phosphoenolpyruvate--protein phosphotransferase [Sedimentisphaera cyanobacteriorum]AQQ09503.1 Phosphoenolpyruvate-protein phosphotransferase [Sedimentisphaera cyanobacteriorum]